MSNVSEPIMSVSVTFRHTEPTDSIKNYATDKILSKVKKFINGSADIDIILTVEKVDHTVEVRVGGKSGIDIDTKATTENLYSAIDKVTDTLDALLRKHKDKMVSSYRQNNEVQLEI